MNITNCRSCGSSNLSDFLSLGDLPLSRTLIHGDQLSIPEKRYPLTLTFCRSCSLVQLTHTVNPAILFCHEHPYRSSAWKALLTNAEEMARFLSENHKLGPESLVVEIGSNDGYLLQYFAQRNIQVLGIEPSELLAAEARTRKVPTLTGFYTEKVSEVIIAAHGKADIVILNNTLAHLFETNRSVAGIARLLKDDGVAIIEVPYVADLIAHREFDTITHEHMCYFSLTALQKLFARHGMTITHVERTKVHGGSLWFTAWKGDIRQTPSVGDLWAEEQLLGLDHLGFYAGFAEKVGQVRAALLDFLVTKKTKGKRIVAYGAAAKGATLLNYCNISRNLIEYVVDKDTSKHGQYMPGSHLPIFPTERLVADNPDYTLLLVWNFAAEIAAQQVAYRAGGGRFILPITLEEFG